MTSERIRPPPPIKVLFKTYSPPDWSGIRDNFSFGKVKPFVGKVRLVGSQRLRFAEDVLDNAVLACARMGATETQVGDLLKVVAYCRSRFSSEYQRIPSHAELSVLLKTVDFWSGSWSGFYTLFNKLSLNPGVDVWDIFEKRITGWLLTKSNLSPDAIWPYMKAEMDKCSSESTLMSFEDFLLNRDLWGRSGAVDAKDEVRRGWVKSKGAFAYSKDDAALRKWWLKHRDTIRPWSLIQKEEPGAVRLVVLTDIVTYLKLAYIMLWWDSAASENTALFNYSDDQVGWWARAADPSYYRGKKFLLGDYQNFDESATRELLRLFNLELINRVSVPDEDFGHIFGVVDQLYNATVRLPTGEVVDVVNGLASGLRITTFFNSIFNAAIMRMANELLRNPSTLLAVLGDDSVNEVGADLSIADFSSAIAPSGVTLHLRKSYIGETIEFLKLSAVDNRVSGNPVRALRALLWSSEDEKDSTGNAATAKMRLALWAKFLSRCESTFEEAWPLVMFDVSRATKLPQNVIDMFMRTVSSGGGGGVTGEYTTVWQSVRTGTAPRAPRAPRIQVSKTLFPVWREGLKKRLTDFVKHVSISILSGFSALKKYAVSCYSRDTSQIRPLGPTVPLNRNHDELRHTLAGVRSRKEFYSIRNELYAMSESVVTTSQAVFNKFTGKLAIAIVTGSDPTIQPAPLWATIRYGEVLDILTSRIATHRVRAWLPSRCSIGQLIGLSAAVEAQMYRLRI